MVLEGVYHAFPLTPEYPIGMLLKRTVPARARQWFARGHPAPARRACHSANCYLSEQDKVFARVRLPKCTELSELISTPHWEGTGRLEDLHAASGLPLSEQAEAVRFVPDHARATLALWYHATLWWWARRSRFSRIREERRWKTLDPSSGSVENGHGTRIRSSKV
ncbi:hypothetical protein GQ53DRAFT_319786 [Thozetella sp. PMI_491]|nr:hypothetical protein GQ53DRAFT_319786 [Thozetella sp. PMI_491]